MNKLIYRFCFFGASFYYLMATLPSQAQVSSDGTLSTDVTTTDNQNFIINSGSRAGGNLFHSFRDFSIPTGGAAVFNNVQDVRNIISRVTGSSVSNIDGLIRANGSANLFLINPNGIIFGRNAALQIGGSFLATTANRLNFVDGSFFSTTDTQAQPLLSVNVPIGLQFGATAASIVNRSVTEDISGFPIGLQVQPSKTLALVGGDVSIEGGTLSAPGGRIELGSIASSNFVNLTPTLVGWNLEYESVQNFQDLQLSQASVYLGGESLGELKLQGRRIAIADGSQIGGNNVGVNSDGTIALNASESITLSGNSRLNTGTFSTGTAGEITIATRQLSIDDGAIVDALSNGNGRGGNITVDAVESVEIDGNGQLTQITSQAFSRGDAGDIRVKTSRLILRNGGQIASSTARGSTGNGGTVIVNASESVTASGRGKTFDGRVRASGLFAVTTEQFTTGNGGNLQVNTKRLIIRDGASLSVAAVNGSTGQAGTLDLNASEFVEVSGIDSSLLATSASPKSAGDLTINTGNLYVQNRAEVAVSSEGIGNAGNLEVTANSMRVENGGKLTATSKLSSDSGNINIQNLDLLTLRNTGEISTSAEGAGNGGNINIDTDNLVLAERSNIIAQAVDGRGGNISITTQGLFVSPDSTINASSDRGINGIVEIRRPDVDPSAELVILPADVVDVSGLVAQGCSATGGVASGESSFAITGRGGLPPTPAEATRSDSILADLGITEKSKVKTSQIPTPDYAAMMRRFPPPPPASRLPTPTESSNKVNPAPLVEATGWVVGSNGEVVLTASVTTDTLNIPWFKPNSCNGT